ncbi:peroxidase-related enzyme [Ornithinimicrobium humiphilum]|uniref:Alkylhydroperoxidase domain protein n=1 Tax=Ornithinimicrobium humiphilum TaxID=125288 RepID=A0A543KLB0_9MICO|nr:alkylhydroperoxidase domain protein [Ornithinimicrobium humiphilum]
MAEYGFVTATSTAPALLARLLDADAATGLPVDPEVLTETRAAMEALYDRPQPLGAPVLRGLAAVVAAWQGIGPLHDHHVAAGADESLLADAEPTDAKLAALRRHVDLLTVSPALATHADQEALIAAGATPDEVVLVSQLVAYESYLARVLVTLAALEGEEVPAVPAPGRVPTSRGRTKLTTPTTRSGSARPLEFTQEVLAWEPWVPAPAEDELTDEQRESFARKATTNSVYFRLLSRTPGVTRARSDLDNAIFLRRDGLPRAERELAAAVASKVNDCIYCASVHARKSTGFSKRGEDVDAVLAVRLPRDADWVATDLAPLAESVAHDPRWATVVDAAARLSALRPTFGPSDVARMRQAGLEDLEVVDLATATAFFAWANRLMLSLGEAACPAPSAA